RRALRDLYSLPTRRSSDLANATDGHQSAPCGKFIDAYTSTYLHTFYFTSHSPSHATPHSNLLKRLFVQGNTLCVRTPSSPRGSVVPHKIEKHTPHAFNYNPPSNSCTFRREST